MSSIDVIFSEPINTSSVAPARLDADRQRRGQPDQQAARFSLTPASGTTSTYAIGDLSGLTAAVGTYTLTVNAADIQDTYGNAGTGSLSTSWQLIATTPTITWTNPANIVYGTPLGPTQLDATASVAGTFVYAPAAGTVLTAGKTKRSSDLHAQRQQRLHHGQRANTLSVQQATPTITWANPATSSTAPRWGQRSWTPRPAWRAPSSTHRPPARC